MSCDPLLRDPKSPIILLQYLSCSRFNTVSKTVFALKQEPGLKIKRCGTSDGGSELQHGFQRRRPFLVNYSLVPRSLVRETNFEESVHTTFDDLS